MSLRLDTPIQYLKGVGPKFGELLHSKGINTVRNLLEWYPRTYEDRRAARNIASLKDGELVSLKAQIVRVSSFQLGRSRRKMYDVAIRDASGSIHCKYFRVPYKGYFERFQPQQLVRVIGKVILYRGKLEFHHPDIQDYNEESEETDLLIPIYPESEGLTNRHLRKLMQVAFRDLEPERVPGMPAPIPAETNRRTDARSNPQNFSREAPPPLELLPLWLREKYNLIPRSKALLELHLPPSQAGAEYLNFASPAHRRVIFEEFFWLELYLAARKSGMQRQAAPAMKNDLSLAERLEKSLPFALTGAQKRAFSEISRDLVKPHPMHRLVQGDVGSGKTLVAVLAALQSVASGYQVALMVPTEILAEQHYANLKKFLEPLGLTIGLLTGAQKTADRNATLQLLKQGAIQICVGTHALIQEEVEFNQLGLVIVDEQHRFGVHQRSHLKLKGKSPHFLVMTATPIPRTLAMTVYGDLDVSIIDELPAGRAPITTRMAFSNKKLKVLHFMQEQLSRGRQVYVVYPLVEESEKMDLQDAVTAHAKLTEQLKPYRVGLLHGRMKSAEKDEIMREFRAGTLQVLVSTTVIEVGVDVPNANLMVIEHAERFGLSQLHQLRGRVGRGQHKSYCVLLLGHAVSDEARARASIMESTTDGFKISEADLELRGPGEFLGTRQSGLPGFRLANLVRDQKILAEAREAAFEVLSRDPTLRFSDHCHLRNELTRTHGAAALASVG